MGKISEAQKKAVNKYVSATYDKILLRIRKDTEPTRETITAAANEKGESLNGYIMEAVKRRLIDEGKGAANGEI